MTEEQIQQKRNLLQAQLQQARNWLRTVGGSDPAVEEQMRQWQNELDTLDQK